MIRVFSFFSGYDAPVIAMNRYGMDYKLVGTSEINDQANIAHKALHGKVRNYFDITQIEPSFLPDFDLGIYTFPCTTVSVAGLRKGMKEGSGTESSLLWEVRKVVHVKRPKYLMMENVKNLVGRNFKKYFDMWLEELRDLGYNNYWKMINAKNCGIPHNRERIFCVSILKEHDNFGFQFYDDFDSGIRLKDVLEPEVDEKYYLSEKKTKALIESLEANGYETNEINVIGEIDINAQDSIKRVYDPEGISPTLTTMGGGDRQPKIVERTCIDKSLKNTKEIDIANCIAAREDRGISNRSQEGTAVLEKIAVTCAQRGRNPENPTSRKSGLPTEQILEISDYPDIMNCITTVQKDTMVLEKVKYLIRIRKLTPREVFRLMGLLDSEIDKIMATGLKDTHLYRLGGNSIVVNAMKFLDQLK